jgi:hypothetical protein
MANNIDPELVRDMMRSTWGEGIASLPPSSGAGVDNKKVKYHLMKPLRVAKNSERIGNSLMEELKKKIVDI